jgi:hypothetical protein
MSIAGVKISDAAATMCAGLLQLPTMVNVFCRLGDWLDDRRLARM